LFDRGIKIFEGDYFTYGENTYEIVSAVNLNNYFGQEEYNVSYKIIGKLARPGEFDPKTFFPPSREKKGLPDGIQEGFVQQRGLQVNNEGTTGDIRQTRERLKEELPEIALGEGPRIIESKDKPPPPDTTDLTPENESFPTSFYDQP
jgi:hypothetical protein